MIRTNHDPRVIWPSTIKARNCAGAAGLNAKMAQLCAGVLETDGPRAFECPKSAAAFHEAGHCIISAHDGVPPSHATIWPIVVAGQSRWIGRTYFNVKYSTDAKTSPEEDQKFAEAQLAGVVAEWVFDLYRAGSSLDEILSAQVAIMNASIKSGRQPEVLYRDVIDEIAATLKANKRIAREIADVLMSKHVIGGSRLKQALAQVRRVEFHGK
jgi:hypothetical protein